MPERPQERCGVRGMLGAVALAPPVRGGSSVLLLRWRRHAAAARSDGSVGELLGLAAVALGGTVREGRHDSEFSASVIFGIEALQRERRWMLGARWFSKKSCAHVQQARDARKLVPRAVRGTGGTSATRGRRASARIPEGGWAARGRSRIFMYYASTPRVNLGGDPRTLDRTRRGTGAAEHPRGNLRAPG